MSKHLQLVSLPWDEATELIFASANANAADASTSPSHTKFNVIPLVNSIVAVCNPTGTDLTRRRLELLTEMALEPCFFRTAIEEILTRYGDSPPDNLTAAAAAEAGELLILKALEKWKLIRRKIKQSSKSAAAAVPTRPLQPQSQPRLTLIRYPPVQVTNAKPNH
jgi:hypothetical protein